MPQKVKARQSRLKQKIAIRKAQFWKSNLDPNVGGSTLPQHMEMNFLRISSAALLGERYC